MVVIYYDREGNLCEKRASRFYLMFDSCRVWVYSTEGAEMPVEFPMRDLIEVKEIE